MPRKPSLPKYRHHKSTNRAVVTLSGHDHYLGRYDSPESHAEYDRLIALWAANGRSLPPERSADLTVVEVLDAYWSQAKAGAAPNLHRIKAALAPALDLYGTTAAAAFNGPALKACRQRLVGAGHCRKHVNQLVDTLRRAWAWAVSEDLVPADVLTKLEAVEGLRRGRTAAPESEPVKPAALEDVRGAQACMAPQVSALVELQLLTGARPGEVVILRPCDIGRGGDVWTYRPERHKGQHRGKARTIYLGPKAQAVLTPWLADRAPSAYCFSPREVELARREALGQKAKVSKRTPPGECYTVRSYARAIATACQRAKVEHWHPHQLRHTAATLLVEEVGWDTARIILGHSTVSTTRVYAEDNARAAAEAMRKVG